MNFRVTTCVAQILCNDNACIFTGDYKVTVFYCGQKVKGSPFVSNAFDASKVVVSKMPAGGMVGRPVTFDSEYYYCHLGLIARKSFFVVCSWSVTR